MRQNISACNVWFARVPRRSQSLPKLGSVNGFKPEQIGFRQCSVGLGDE
jgi:hypothetical protein